MIIALLLLVLPVVLGISITSRIRELSSSVLELFAFGAPIGIALTISAMFLADYIVGYPTNVAIYSVLSISAVFTLLLNYKSLLRPFTETKASRHRAKKPNPKIAVSKLPRGLNIAIILTILIVGSVFVTSLASRNGAIICSHGGCSDALFHIGIGNSVALHGFPPPYPYTAGVINTYPFMADFYSALLNRFGMGLIASVMLPDLLLLFCIISISGIFAYRISGSEFVSISALILFWFGGSGIIKLLSYPLIRYASLIVPSSSLLHLFGPTGTVLQMTFSILQMSATQITYWTSIIDSMLIMQRDLLLGLPLGLAAIFIVYISCFESQDPAKQQPHTSMDLLLAGVLLGMMPLINPSTVIVLSVVFICAAAFDMLRIGINDTIRKWLGATIAFGFIAFMELLYMMQQQRQSPWSFFLHYPAIAYSGGAFLTLLTIPLYLMAFWIMVVGIPALLVVPGLMTAPKKLKRLFIPFLLLWVLVSVYSPQPNPGDSNKVFIYVFFVICISASYALLWAYERNNSIFKSLAILMVVLTVYSYVFLYFPDVTAVQMLVNPAQNAASSFIRSVTPSNAIFAESDYGTFNAIPSTMGARSTLLSYAMYVGVIYTYPVSEVTNATKQIFASGDCQDIKRFNISYIYLTPASSMDLKPFQNDNFILLYNSSNKSYDGIKIFKTKCG